MKNWKIYNHALIPTTAPHEKPHIEELNSARGNWLFARYTTDFDCGYPTEWWYCIKEEPINLDLLKSKQRCEIKKALKNCVVKRIDPKQYKDKIWNVYISAYQKYKKVRHNVSKECFVENLKQSKEHFWGCFVDDALVGYGMIADFSDYVSYSVLKYSPDYLRQGISAALIYQTVNYYLNNEKKKYIMNSERSICHDSNIQEYLEKTFGFRKAYCKLHVIYKPRFRLLVKALYPFRRCFQALSSVPIMNDIYAVLKQEGIVRTFLQ